MILQNRPSPNEGMAISSKEGSEWDPNNILLVSDDGDLIGVLPSLLNRGYGVRVADTLVQLRQLLIAEIPGFLVMGWHTNAKEPTLPFLRELRLQDFCNSLPIVLACDSGYQRELRSREFEEYEKLATVVVDWLYGLDAVYNHIRAIERKRGYKRLVARSYLPDGYVDLDANIVHRSKEDSVWNCIQATVVRQLINSLPGSVPKKSLSRYWTEGEEWKLLDVIDAINGSLGVDGIVKDRDILYRWALPIQKVIT